MQYIVVEGCTLQSSITATSISITSSASSKVFVKVGTEWKGVYKGTLQGTVQLAPSGNVIYPSTGFIITASGSNVLVEGSNVVLDSDSVTITVIGTDSVTGKPSKVKPKISIKSAGQTNVQYI